MFAFLEWPKQLMYACACIWLITTLLMMQLPGAHAILPSLYQEPLQTPTALSPFTFSYHNHDISVTPLAEYSLWGVVVSHNDPKKWYNFDISHDENSPNTRDICIVWGKNLKSDDYKKVRYSNDDNFCLYSYGPTIHFNEDEVANNHLITTDAGLRERIGQLHVGDQVLIKGKLVSYNDPGQGWQNNLRASSMNRYDRGDGACEIILVEELQMLDSHNRLWIILNELGFWGFISLAIFRAGYFFFGPREL